MIHAAPQGSLGFSLNPLHYAKTAVRAQGKIFKAEAAVGSLPGASNVVNSIVPGSGRLLTVSNAAYSTIGNKLDPGSGGKGGPGGGVQAMPNDGGSDDGGVGPRPDTILGLPKKYVIVGGAVLGGIVLLKLLTK